MLSTTNSEQKSNFLNYIQDKGLRKVIIKSTVSRFLTKHKNFLPKLQVQHKKLKAVESFFIRFYKQIEINLRVRR